jgi:hypothetical protein
MTAEASRLFEDGEWIVAKDGLEHQPSGYFIAGSVLGERRPDGLWAWPLHLAQKNWCRMAALAPAFRHAVRRFGLTPDGLEESLAEAWALQAERDAWDRRATGHETALRLRDVVALSPQLDALAGASEDEASDDDWSTARPVAAAGGRR